MVDAKKITRQSKSNLALAFVALDRERRSDITLFYAFCRVIDDIADSSYLLPAQKAGHLNAWRESLRMRVADEPALAGEIRALLSKYPRLNAEMFAEIIAGVEMDLTISRYKTFAELRLYCYRVASVVGLVSIEIFGYRNPQSRDYAIELGLALQVTNIIRDVGKDLSSGRIYLPQEDMARFDYSESDLDARKDDARFVKLMQFEAERAEGFFRRAKTLLPREDRRSMMAAEIMASVYHALLARIRSDGFHVFEKNYRIGKLHKGALVAAHLLHLR